MANRLLYNFVIKRPKLFCCKNLRTSELQFNYYASQYHNNKPSILSQYSKKALLTVCCFSLAGGAYAYFTVNRGEGKRFSSSLIELADPFVLAEAPNVTPSRQVAGPVGDMGMKFLLYQYQSCPFCCKVRAFLDYYGIPYDVVEVNPLMRQQIKFSKYKKVPILVVEDKKTGVKHQLNDSSIIISILGTLLLSDHKTLQEVLKYYAPVSYTDEKGKEVQEVLNQYSLMFGDKNTKTTEELMAEKKWRQWVDKEFVHVLSPNIYRSHTEAVQAFNHFSKVGEWDKNFSAFEQMTAIYVGAAAMYFIGKKLKKKYALKDDVRDSLYDSCKFWMKSIGKAKFMGGDSPNLADLAVFGLLNSIEGCEAFQDLLSNTNIGPWFHNMKDAVGSHHGYQEIKYKF